MEPLFAQEPAETRKWVGGGEAFGTYGQSDVDKSEDLEGITLEIMLSHRIFDDSMALGKAFMDTRFEHGFEDSYGNYHHIMQGSFTDITPLDLENPLSYTTSSRWVLQQT